MVAHELENVTLSTTLRGRNMWVESEAGFINTQSRIPM